MGTCQKCGQYKMVRDHHYKGYDTDETAPYCQSCDIKAHNWARWEGKCNLSAKEAKRKRADYYRRKSTLSFWIWRNLKAKLSQIIEKGSCYQKAPKSIIDI